MLDMLTLVQKLKAVIQQWEDGCITDGELIRGMLAQMLQNPTAYFIQTDREFPIPPEK